jgi:hypothetical protein
MRRIIQFVSLFIVIGIIAVLVLSWGAGPVVAPKSIHIDVKTERAKQ